MICIAYPVTLDEYLICIAYTVTLYEYKISILPYMDAERKRYRCLLSYRDQPPLDIVRKSCRQPMVGSDDREKGDLHGDLRNGVFGRNT